MKHILIAPDKFKGSLTTFEACEYIRAGIHNADPTLQVSMFPVADGGDGFAEVMQHYLHTKTVQCATVDPLGRPLLASYQLNEQENTAIIELAIASGLVLLKEKERDPLKTSTYGTGMQIKDALSKGCRKVILGLGGSATNDAGTGILSALGFRFSDVSGSTLLPCGGNLHHIKKIDPPDPDLIPSLEFVIASDVQNILYGPQGAAYQFAGQKGADEKTIQQLDKGLNNFANLLEAMVHKDISKMSGTGAAGGIAAGLMGFFPTKIKKGIEMVLDASDIRNSIAHTNLVITGEGKMDEQTLDGKVIMGITRLAQQFNKPVFACCGECNLSPAQVKSVGIQEVFSLMERSFSKQDAMAQAGTKLQETAAAAITIFKQISYD